MDPEAWPAFLPAYLFRALEKTEWRLLRSLVMSPEQIEAIRAFLLFVQENVENAKWFERYIPKALAEVWK